VALLLEAGADIEARADALDSYRTPLQIAVMDRSRYSNSQQSASLEVVSTLLEAGADVEAVDEVECIVECIVESSVYCRVYCRMYCRVVYFRVVCIVECIVECIVL
jgi:hypothetical protein